MEARENQAVAVQVRNRLDRIEIQVPSATSARGCRPWGQYGCCLNVIRDLVSHETPLTVDLTFASDGLSYKVEIPLGPSIADVNAGPRW
jgi:hypothetical protein